MVSNNCRDRLHQKTNQLPDRFQHSEKKKLKSDLAVKDSHSLLLKDSHGLLLHHILHQANKNKTNTISTVTFTTTTTKTTTKADMLHSGTLEGPSLIFFIWSLYLTSSASSLLIFLSMDSALASTWDREGQWWMAHRTRSRPSRRQTAACVCVCIWTRTTGKGEGGSTHGTGGAHTKRYYYGGDRHECWAAGYNGNGRQENAPSS